MKDDVRDRDKRAERIVEVVRHAAGQHAQGLQSFAGRRLFLDQSFLDAAFVAEHGSLDQFPVQANAS